MLDSGIHLNHYCADTFSGLQRSPEQLAERQRLREQRRLEKKLAKQRASTSKLTEIRKEKVKFNLHLSFKKCATQFSGKLICNLVSRRWLLELKMIMIESSKGRYSLSNRIKMKNPCRY